MIEPLIKPRPNACSACLIGIFFLVVAACGSGSAPSETAPRGSGTIPLQIAWKNKTNNGAIPPRAQIVCAELGVQTVVVQVYAQSDNAPVVSASWGCEDHQGTIHDVPAGTFAVVVMGNHSGDQPIYHAAATGIIVPAGGSADPVVIDMTPFVPTLSSTSNGITLQWDSISGAVDYEVNISGNADMSDSTAYIAAGPSYSPVDLTDGVRYYWCVKANDAYGNQSAGSGVGSFVASASACIDGIEPTSYWRFDETSNPFADSFGGNNAVCGSVDMSCPTQIADGRSGYAQRFSSDASTGLAVTGTSGDFDWAYNESFSIAAWIKVGQTTATDVIVGRVDESSTAELRWFLAISPDGTATARIKDRSGAGSGDNGQFTGTTLLADDTWHYLVLVRDDSQDQNLLYVDGQLEASILIDYPVSGGFASDELITIGWLNIDTRHRLTGSVDEVAIYSQALSGSTIAKHYANGQEGLGYCDPD